MESAGICPDRSWQSMKERFNKKILTNLARFKVTRTKLIKADEDKAKALTGVSGKGVTEQTGSSRRPYSRSDDKAILNHLVNNQEYARVGGRQLWVEMEGLGVVSGRSWQSLKEHFRRSIMPNIRSFRFLTKQQRSSLEAREIVKEADEEKVAELSPEKDEAALEELVQPGRQLRRTAYVCYKEPEDYEESGIEMEEDQSVKEVWTLEEACTEGTLEETCTGGWESGEEEEEVEEVYVSYILVDF